MEDSIILIWLVRCHRLLLTNPTRTDYAKSKKNQETLKKDVADWLKENELITKDPVVKDMFVDVLE